MLHRKWKSDLLLLLKFVFPFLLVIAIPMTASYGLSSFMLRTHRRDVLDSYSVMLKNNMHSIEYEFSQIESTIDSMARNKTITHFLQADSYPISELRLLSQALNSYNIQDDLIQNVFLYNPRLDYIVDIWRGYLSAASFWDAHMQSSGADYDSWIAALRDMKWVRRYDGYPSQDDTGYRTLSYTQSVPFKYQPTGHGKIVILLNQETLLQRYADLFSGNGENLFILDSGGNLLLSMDRGGDLNALPEFVRAGSDPLINRPVSMNGQKFIVSRYVSSSGNRTYIYLIPERDIMSGADVLNRVVMVLCFLALLLGVIASIAVASKKAKSFTQVTAMMDKYGVRIREKMGLSDIRKNEYDYLRDGMDQLVTDNLEYKTELDQRRAHSVYQVMDKLLNGKYTSSDILSQDLALAGMDLHAPKHVLLILQLGREYRLDIGGKNVKEFIRDSLYLTVNEYFYLHETSARNLALLFSFDAPDDDIYHALTGIVSKIRTSLAYPYDIEMTFGASDICSLDNIGQALSQAMVVIEYNALGYNTQLLFHKDLPSDADWFYYPVQLENRLYNYAVIGDKAEVQNTLDEIYNENFVRRSLSVVSAEKLIHSLHSTTSKIVGSSGNALSLQDGNSITEVFWNVNDILQKHCDGVLAQNKQENKNTTEKIKEYIDSSYTNPDLSLSDLSIRFNLNEKYLSSLFKENMGQKFSTYVENLRMDAACRLIAEGQHQIRDIAQMIGYTNDVSFRRAFRRCKGITPSAYAEKLKQ